MLNKPIAVLGGGNGGHCMAADLTLAGHKVHFYEHPAFATRFEPTLEGGTIKLTGIGRTGTARIHKVTTDMGEALDGAGMIHLSLPANGHETFFDEMIPHLESGQAVIVWAGDFGSLRLRHLLQKRAPDKDVLIYEGHTLPYGARLSGPAEVDLLLATPSVMVSALPAARTGEAMEALQTLYPVVVAGRNVLIAAFNNPNPIIHPPGSLLNTGRIQYSGGDFNMYREGITEAVARVIRWVFDEVTALADHFGGGMIEYLDRDFRTTASIMGVAFDAPFDTLGVIASIAGPHTIYDRYITEDLPFGLVPMVELGRKFGVPTPTIEGIVNIGCAVCDTDFWSTGRTLDTLGIADLDRDGILALVDG